MGEDAAQKPLNVALVQTTLPSYRVPFVVGLQEIFPSLVVGAGSEYFDPSVKRASRLPSFVVSLENRFFLGRRFAYQSGWRAVVKSADVVVFEMNPRIISSWLLLLRGRFTGLPVIAWGHYRGRRLGSVSPGFGRRMQVRLARRVLAYTPADAAEFRKRFPRCRVDAAPNSTEWSAGLSEPDSMPRRNFLYVGRLIASKQLDVVIGGFRVALGDGSIPADSKLVFVGDGPEGEMLRGMAGDLLGRNILFEGEVFDTARLDAFYNASVAGVCGGYVGLNLTQSLSRGVPFIYPSVAPHSPEVSMAAEGENAFSYDPPTSAAVAEQMALVAAKTITGEVDHRQIQTNATREFSIEAMIAGFETAVLAAVNRAG